MIAFIIIGAVVFAVVALFTLALARAGRTDDWDNYHK